MLFCGVCYNLRSFLLMIASLNGIVSLLDTPYIIVEVGGVGYKVLLSNTILSTVTTGQKIKLFIYTHVREDLLDLYGFLQISDLKLFEKLLGVSGIGPKTAIGIFSLGTSSDIISAIVSGDISFFTGVPRLGRKNAQKIIIDLKSKLGSSTDLDLSDGSFEKNNEAVIALKHFGFTTREVQEAMQKTKKDGQTVEEKIKLALKYLGK